MKLYIPKEEDYFKSYSKELEQYIEKLEHENERIYTKLDDNDKEIERLNIIINRIKSIYSSLCFSAPENDYIFIEQLGEVLQELKGSD